MFRSFTDLQSAVLGGGALVGHLRDEHRLGVLDELLRALPARDGEPQGLSLPQQTRVDPLHAGLGHDGGRAVSPLHGRRVPAAVARRRLLEAII